jgi:Holliday junction DNA helicase RuvB
MFTGPPGVGKTLLSQVIATELGGDSVETLGQTLDANSVNALLIGASDRTVLTIDEAHLTDPIAQTMLLRAVEDRVLLLSRKGTRSGETRIPLAGFTLVLATTDPQGILGPLRDRMQLMVQLQHYAPGELAELCRRRAVAMGWTVAPAVCDLIGLISKGTPRLGLRLLQSVWRTATSVDSDLIELSHLERTIALEGIDPILGLDSDEQRYVRVLHEAGTAVRLNVIASRLSLPPRQVSQVVEDYLLRAGLILRTDSGRELTHEGFFHAERLSRQRLPRTGDDQ